MKPITTIAACRILNISRNALYRWADTNVLKMERIGPLNLRVFDYDEVMRLAKKLPKKRAPGVRVLTPKTKRK